jgi:hypothetical protein
MRNRIEWMYGCLKKKLGCLYVLRDDYLSGTDDFDWHMDRHTLHCQDELICGYSLPFLYYNYKLLEGKKGEVFDAIRCQSPINMFLIV